MRQEINEADLAAETSLIEKENQDSSATPTTTLLFTTFVAVSGSYVFGSAIGYSSPVQSDLTNDLNLSVAEYSLFGSILTIGAMIGAATSGRIADGIGRRATMGFSEMFCILGWLAIYLSKVALWLDVGRFLVGYGMGVLSFVVPVYIAEITPKDLRGGFTTVHQLMICLGVSVTYLLGSFIGWRILALIGMVPCVVQMMGLFIIPESPRWLAKVGKWDEFEIALQRLRGESADISYESSEIKDYTRRLSHLSESSIVDLFQPKYAKSLLVGVGLMVLQQFGGVNGIAFYASSIFESAGFSSKIGMIAMVVVQIPMTTIGVLLMDKSGRRPLLLISATGTCIGCFFVGLSFSLQLVSLLNGGTSYLALTGVLMYTGSFSLGMGGIPWVIMSEDSDDEEQPMQPHGMFFGPWEYTETCKVGTRCQVYHTVKLLKTFEEDLPWFEAHSQFKHVFHMPGEQRHMNQGLWMLMLRTARIDTDRECWFMVNGVSIRYSIKEHVLLSGFKCHEYPKEFQPNMLIEDEDLKFAKRMFGKNKKGIKSADVEAKLVEMKDCDEKKVDRKKLAILLAISMQGGCCKVKG